MVLLDIFGIQDNALLAVVGALTGLSLVFLGLLVAKLISPRSFNPQKGEAYECGIPTRGESMSQFKVGYYLFAILFLMFDVDSKKCELKVDTVIPSVEGVPVKERVISGLNGRITFDTGMDLRFNCMGDAVSAQLGFPIKQ